MLRFRVHRIMPPGGRYFYVVPDTEVELTAASMSQLLNKVRMHLAENGKPLPDNLASVVEDYICRHVPPGFCYGDDEGRPHARIVTLGGIRENTIRIARHSRLVDPGEAKLRLERCSKCPMNDRRLCPSCVGLIAWARNLVKRSCPRDEWLGVCAVDITALAAKIHVASVPVVSGYPDTCWVVKGEVK